MLGKSRILLYFNDVNLASLLTEFLASHSIGTFMLDYSGNVVSTVQRDNYAAIIMEYNSLYAEKLLDIVSIRMLDSSLPVVVVAPGDTGSDIAVEAYNNGADLFMRRSFSLEELLLRLQILVSCSVGDEALVADIRIGSLMFNPAGRTIRRADNSGQMRTLTPIEAQILEMLASSGGDIVSRAMLLRSVWHNDNLSNTGALDVYITRLRHLLSVDQSITIYNMRSRGYRLVVADDSPSPKLTD